MMMMSLNNDDNKLNQNYNFIELFISSTYHLRLFTIHCSMFNNISRCAWVHIYLESLIIIFFKSNASILLWCDHHFFLHVIIMSERWAMRAYDWSWCGLQTTNSNIKEQFCFIKSLTLVICEIIIIKLYKLQAFCSFLFRIDAINGNDTWKHTKEQIGRETIRNYNQNIHF